jgi:hypothetical protein
VGPTTRPGNLACIVGPIFRLVAFPIDFFFSQSLNSQKKMDTSSNDEASDEELLVLLTVLLCFNEQNALPRRRGSTQGRVSV